MDFVWDDISVGPRHVFDPWVMLGGMALVTERITLGAMVFSLARRRPWKVARESLTIGDLSTVDSCFQSGLAEPGMADAPGSARTIRTVRCAPRASTNVSTS